MTRAVAVIALVTGCLGRPVPHGTIDANDDHDGSSDGIQCRWQGPFPLVIPQIQPSDALAGPWLSDDRKELWYTYLANGSPPATINRATFGATGTTISAEIGIAPTSYANPFYDESRNSVWFDKTPLAGTTILGELVLVGRVLVAHAETNGMRQPTLSPDGSKIFVTQATADSVTGGAVSAGFVDAHLGIPNPGTEQFSSPSVTRDGTTLYVTDRIGTQLLLVVATLTPAGDNYTNFHEVESFQLPGKNYFDPSISRDGLTLAFASNFEGGQPRLYYVMRDQACSP